MRRLIDVAFALFWLILTAPLLLLIALWIKLESPGPILYVPRMVGHRGRTFRLLRFRTMYVDHLRRPQHQKHPRSGRFIRNYSLDHLPTLLNLLSGDLTLIGPRPMEPEVVDLQATVWQRYFEVRPGLFNYAVLKLGRQWTPSRTRNPQLNQELELAYLQQRSGWSDLQLCLDYLRAFVASRGNIKARGASDPSLRQTLDDDIADGG